MWLWKNVFRLFTWKWWIPRVSRRLSGGARPCSGCPPPLSIRPPVQPETRAASALGPGATRSDRETENREEYRNIPPRKHTFSPSHGYRGVERTEAPCVRRRTRGKLRRRIRCCRLSREECRAAVSRTHAARRSFRWRVEIKADVETFRIRGVLF